MRARPPPHTIAAAFLMLLAGCSLVRDEGSANTVRHRFALPPAQAAGCFARNAEAHSSALVAEVGTPDARGAVTVIVRVKNGVLYADAHLHPAGARSEGTLNLMVVTKGGIRALVDSLVEGC